MDPSPVLRLLPRATLTPAEQFLRLVSDPFRTQIQQSAFLASLGTSIGVTLLVALIFCFLRPLNTVVYAPRIKHSDLKHAPPPIGKGVFAWVKPLITTKEQQLVEKVGLDAAVFIRFTNMCRNIFLVLSLVGCAVIIPVNVVGGRQFSQNVAGFMKLTPQFMIGQVYWALVAIAWTIDLVVCVFLYINSRAIVRLRRAYLESPEYQNSLYARTLMVTEVPKTLRTDEGVVRIVDEVQSAHEFPRGAIARNVRDLPDMIEEHSELVKQLESVLAKYLKNPDSLPATRPMCKQSKKDPNFIKGQKVDAIEYLTNRIKDLETRITEVRQQVDQRDAMSYGFASYETVAEAHAVAFAARRKHPHGTNITLAPKPSNIIWQNLPLTKGARRTRSITNNLWIFVLTVIWTFCNALLAVFISNLANLGQVWKAFDTELHRDPKLWAVIQGVAAPALTSLFYLILPTAFRRLSQRAGDLSKTSRERHVMSKLYTFFVFNNLIVFSVFGALWQFIATVVQVRNSNADLNAAIRAGDIWNKIMIAFCNVSPFWISWLLQRNLGAAIDLSQVVNLAWGSFARRFLSPTPRQLIQYTAPPPFDYASYYNYFLFYTTVALCFATLQPLVLPVTAFYFCLDSYLKKYLIMYVFVTKMESGGMFWRSLFNRVVFAAILSNFIVGALVKAKGINYVPMLVALAPLPLLMIAFKLYCSRKFDAVFKYYAQRLDAKEDAIVPDNKSIRSNNVGVRFGHPALYRPLLTPMVHAKSQHMLAKVYQGRLDEDDEYDNLAPEFGGYGMRSLRRGPQKKAPHAGFEFVSEGDMDFANYKDRDDFKDENGDGELYGGDKKAPLAPAPPRAADGPAPPQLDGPVDGTVYPAGYHTTPSGPLRGYSPSPDGRARGGLLGDAAPMGASDARSMSGRSAATTPGEEPGPVVTDYDYFRGRR
ncbi:DUF221-domain-containing protein [Trichodelitschia bisporula]|uniref:DUF221-domain-containing protein n=1 Tax=Trichodelitschia bisporula TaxID=703511 RepID=A0A6G1HRB8_9PEZI|nr:DUF221-domain-containing protein [Trichodelitschia bisporula]